MAVDIMDYWVPLKKDKEMPTLRYDLALYCELMKEIIPGALPKYLHTYREKLLSYAKQKDKVKPSQYPDAYRVYIIDYRLNFLFASHDSTGKIATFFSKYPAQNKDLEYYYYGDGELIGDLWPGQSHDANSMQKFKKLYGFLPIEELAMSAALVLDGDEFMERRLLSQFQTSLLIEKFRRYNFIDWNQYIGTATEEIW